MGFIELNLGKFAQNLVQGDRSHRHIDHVNSPARPRKDLSQSGFTAGLTHGLLELRDEFI